MMRRLVRAAIRNATVTHSEGVTLRLDPLILTAANILPLEEVEVVNHATGERVVWNLGVRWRGDTGGGKPPLW